MKKLIICTMLLTGGIGGSAQFNLPHEKSDVHYRYTILQHPSCYSQAWTNECEMFYQGYQQTIPVNGTDLTSSIEMPPRAVEDMPETPPRMPSLPIYISRDVPASAMGTECPTLLNGTAPYPAWDTIQDQVFANDSYCCNTAWDAICQSSYDAILNGLSCATVETGSSPYGYDDPFFVSVINADPFCCNNTWDAICQSEYDALIGDCPSYASALPPPYPSSDPYVQEVMNLDTYCCSNAWDSVCEDEYQALIIGDCPSFSSTSPPPYSPYDEFLQEVIAMDSYCCSNFWDNICQSEYDALWIINGCSGLSEAVNPTAYQMTFYSPEVMSFLLDIAPTCCSEFTGECAYIFFDRYFGCTNPSAANYDDLAVQDDGSCASCDGDIDGDGLVGSSDLLTFLGAYGSACSVFTE